MSFVEDFVDEAYLGGGVGALRQERGEWLLGGPLDRPLRADAMGEQEALQLVEITWSERLVAAQALHGEVILVNLEEVFGAKAELHILDETTYRLSGSDQLRKLSFSPIQL